MGTVWDELLGRQRSAAAEKHKEHKLIIMIILEVLK